jgi:tetrapyrrole methylase family protein/MazG family protein
MARRVMDGGDETVFAVPGNPVMGEEAVRELSESTEIEILPAPSFVDAVLADAGIPVSGALQIWNAHDPDSHWPDPRATQIVYQVDSRDAASLAKLRLLKFFPPEHEIAIVAAAGTSGSRVTRLGLAQLDHVEFDPFTSLVCPAVSLQRPYGFYGLVDIVDRLLGPGGCPWDREQTHESLKKHLVEETYEALEAIDSGDPEKLCEELGDVLLQAVMHAQMDAIEGVYDIDDVVAGISEKLVRRHPHVFGEVSVANAEEVLSNWDAIKQEEQSSGASSILSGVPKAMPSLLRAGETSKRAARVGFEWESLEDVFAKFEEERGELLEAVASGDQAQIEHEVGDLAFTLVNIARWLKVEPEEALRKMVDRFTTRFQQMERAADKPLRDLSPAEWDSLWNEAKV